MLAIRQRHPSRHQTNDHDGVASAAGDAAAADAAVELNPGAKEPKLQCFSQMQQDATPRGAITGLPLENEGALLGRSI